jgi:dolichol-phosphate mannosyltransferase
MEPTCLTFEVIMVNDGSTDNTLQILRKEADKDPRIKVVTYDKNMGKGYAVRTGVMKSQGRATLYIDGDLDISPYKILDYLDALKTDDLVIASKAHPLSKVNSTLTRRVLSKGFRSLVKLMLGLQTSDTQSGLKAGNGDTFRMIFEQVMTKRYAFDVELLAIAHLANLRIKEMPIDLSINRRFKVKDMLAMFRDLIVISYRCHRATAHSHNLLRPQIKNFQSDNDPNKLR